MFSEGADSWEGQAFVLFCVGGSPASVPSASVTTICLAVLSDHQRVKGQDLRTAVECDEPGDASEGPGV